MIESTNEQWIENVKYMLDQPDPDVIRCHEGGGPEDLIMSLVLTLSRTRNSRDAALKKIPKMGWMESEIENGNHPILMDN